MNEIEVLYKNLLDEAKTQTQKHKLTAIHMVCQAIQKNKGIISIQSVVSILNSKGTPISKQSLYNKIDGKNPYRKLIDAWINKDPTLSLKNIRKLIPFNPESKNPLLSESELSLIPDLVLRYRILGIIQELQYLRKESGFLRSIKNLPEININPSSNSTTNEVTLAEIYTETINNFLKKNIANVISFDENGCAIAKRTINIDERVSGPGLKDALETIVKKHSQLKS